MKQEEPPRQPRLLWSSLIGEQSPQSARGPASSLAPAVLESPLGVLGINAGDRMVGDQDGPGVVEAARLHAIVDRLDDRFDGQLAHSGGELHDGPTDRSISDAAHARATAVD